MLNLLSLGGIVVEIMRPEVDQPLNQAHTFVGPFPSGAATITVSAAARLGWKCAFVGTIGNDQFGEVIMKRFQADQIDLSGIRIDSDRTTGVAFVSYKRDGNRQFIYHCRDAASGKIRKTQFHFRRWEPIDWIHVNGSTLAMNQQWRFACQFAINETLARRGRLSFDPNFRIELSGLQEARQMCFPLIAQSSVFQPSEEEITSLFQTDLSSSIQQALKMGAQIVVVKRGEKGCLIAREREVVEVPGIVVQAVDPTGAGDSFNAAFLFAYQHGLSLYECGRFANIVAAHSTLRLGPMEGCPTIEDLRVFCIEKGEKSIWEKLFL